MIAVTLEILASYTKITPSNGTLYVACLIYRKHTLALVSRVLKVYKQHVPLTIPLLRFIFLDCSLEVNVFPQLVCDMMKLLHL